MKMWYIYKIGIYLVTKNDKIIILVGKMMGLENTILSEVIHT